MTRRTKSPTRCTVCAVLIPAGSVTGGDVMLSINLRTTTGRTTLSAPICTACAAAADDPVKVMNALTIAARGVLRLDRPR
jgi:hypothetical protein